MLESKVIMPPKAGDDVTAAQTATILVALTDNASFPTLAPLVAILQEKQDSFLAILPVAKDGSKAQRIEKNEVKGDVRVATKALVRGVNNVAPNDRVKQATSGIPLNKIVREPRVMGAIKKLVAMAGNLPGSIVITVEKGAFTLSVVYEYTTDVIPGPGSVWTSCGEAEGSCTISGLTSATVIWVRAYALGRRRQKLYTDPIRVVVN
jgi:hypothetical protein